MARNNGNDVSEHVAKLRRERERLTAEREALEKAPLSRGEAEKQLEQRITELAGRVQFDVAPLVSLPSVAPQRRSLMQRSEPRVGMDAEELLAATLAHVWPDRVRQQGREALNAYYATHAEGLAQPARRAAVEKIDRQLTAIEVEEETVIRDAEERGISLDRRPDADPAIVLAAALPDGPPSLERLRQFEALAKRRYDALRGADARRLEALDERGKYAGRLAAAEQDAKRFPGGAGDLAAHRERAEQAQAELDRTTREYEELASQWQRAKQLADNLEKYAHTVGLALERALDPAPLSGRLPEIERLGTYSPDAPWPPARPL